jgi:F-type H+-transporting ATPase subunit a
MGRVMIDMGRRFGTYGVAAAVLLLVAGALYLAAPARATDPERPEGEKAAAGHADKGQSAGEEVAEEEAKDPLDHVMDHEYFELFESFGRHRLPVWLFKYEMFGSTYYFPTKFMLLELLAAVLVAAFYIPMARRLRSGELPTGWNTHAREVLLTYIRDEVARPSIGHDADKYVPFLWTMFLFILFNNLLGMIPFCGSATGSIYVTAGLALCVFIAIHGWGMVTLGPWHYITSLWPDMEVPYGMGYVLKPLIFFLEWLGVLVRNAVLAVRLFANMFAGHVVLATILIFISTAGTLFTDQPAAHWSVWGTVSVLSVLAQIALSLLELFVAFLQAYIFTFLAAIFMGMAMHPAH